MEHGEGSRETDKKANSGRFCCPIDRWPVIWRLAWRKKYVNEPL